jgi:hypothetical protein
VIPNEFDFVKLICLKMSLNFDVELFMFFTLKVCLM